MSRIASAAGAAVLLSAALGATGCRYGTAGSLDPSIRTIGVTVLRNSTSQPGLEGEVTSAVISALQSFGRLSIIRPEDRPDLLLTGTIETFRRNSVRTDRYGDPVRFELEIEAVITVRRADGGHLVKKVRVSSLDGDARGGQVDLTRGESEARGRAAAAEDLGRNIARRILEQGW
ncbi:MAG TPA: LPS assembly lipoprotein LptE [Planctomycetota bacterium]|nr:LPS assembly lipoprotein LptE [Planctomycetota bacterium]